MALNCFRYLNFTSFDEVDKLLPEEYALLMKAVEYRQFDMNYRNHLQAFLNYVVKATKKGRKNKGRPIYDNFKKFFDYDKEIKKIEEKKETSSIQGLGNLLRKERENG